MRLAYVIWRASKIIAIIGRQCAACRSARWPRRWWLEGRRSYRNAAGIEVEPRKWRLCRHGHHFLRRRALKMLCSMCAYFIVFALIRHAALHDGALGDDHYLALASYGEGGAAYVVLNNEPSSESVCLPAAAGRARRWRGRAPCM